MYSSTLFPLFAILIIAMAQEQTSYFLPLSAAWRFLTGVLLYIGLLPLIVWHARKKERAEWFINIELLLFLIIFHFLLAAHILFFSWPFPLCSLSLFSLFLYLFGLFVFYRASGQNTFNKLRLTLPFLIPFLLLTILIDLINYLPISLEQIEEQSPLLFSTIVTTLILFFLALLICLMPFFIQKLWSNQPLENPSLEKRLKKIAAKANFTYAGFKIWQTMPHAYTAAIVGVIPSLRYILFTPRLIKEMPEEALEAILAHEIGHSKQHHLLYYPSLFLGMLVLLTLFTSLFNALVTPPFSTTGEATALVTLYFCYALIIGIYFRFVFGYFSRLFEREADIYPIKLGLPEDQMMQALELVAIASGHPLNEPSWHHGSIEERINFLKEVKKNPHRAKQHHKKVRRSLTAYAIITLLLILFTW